MKNENSSKTGWPLIGNEHIVSFLEKSIANNRIAGAYIFSGSANLGKTTTAVWFAKSLLCEKREEGKFVSPCGTCSSCRRINHDKVEAGFSGIVHSDFHLLKREEDKKNISIEQIREFIKSLSLSSFSGAYKIGVVKNAESLSREASNSLLKTLEEPNKKVVIILVVSDLSGIPNTIASRSQVLDFRPVANGIIYDFLVEKMNASRSLAKNISRLSLGRPALAVKFFEDKDFYADYLAKADLFLNFFNQDLNERLKEMDGLAPRDSFGQENVKKFLTILSIWRGIARDFLLLYSGRRDLIQYEALGDKLEAVNQKFNQNRLLALHKIINQGEEYIKANVGPKLVLENIVCNL